MNKIISIILKLLFGCLVVLLSFNIRLIFNFSQIQGLEGFRENQTWSLYAFDLVLFMFLFLSFLQNLKTIFSRKDNLRWMLFPAIIIVFFLTSTVAADRTAAYYNSFHLMLALLFFLSAKEPLKQFSVFVTTHWIIFLSGVFQSILAVLQFLRQGSFGLKLLGESFLSAQIFDVAKIEISGEKFIRAYGTFPHPNLLGAFLLLSLVSGWWLITRTSLIQRKNFFYGLISGELLILLGILLTFSRSIWLVTLILLLTLLYQNKNLSWLKQLNLKPKHLFAAGLVVIILWGSFVKFIPSRFCITNCPNDKSFSLRVEYSKNALAMIVDHPWLGVGPGNFTIFERHHSTTLKVWEMQPVHNLYLLVASEIGLVGLILFLLILVYYGFNYPLSPFGYLLVGFLFLGLFDHYFWTLVQGQILFWLAVSLASNSTFPQKAP